jgi:outer membrane protein assembly factor BamD
MRGMQRLALELGQLREERLGGASWNSAPAAIHGIPDHRESNMSQVDPNLMSSPALQLGTHERVAAEALQHAVVSDSGSTVGANGHLGPLSAMPPDRLVDGTSARHHAGTYGEVMAFDLAMRQRGNECGMDFRRSRDDQQAARVLIQSVNQPRPGHQSEPGIEPQQGILERVRRVSGARMHDEAGRFVDHQQRLVLEDDLQREALRGHVLGGLQPRVDADLLRAQHLVPGPGPAAVDLDGSRLDPALQSGARILWQRPRKRLIQAQSRHIRGEQEVMGTELRTPLNGRKGRRACQPIGRPIGYTRSNYPARSQRKGPHLMTLNPMRGGALALCVLLLAAAGCRTHRDDLAKSSPEVLYKRAHTALMSYDYNSAIKIYEQLTARFPFTDQTRQARIDLIYAYYRAGESESATDAADTFIRENPTHPRVDYAWYIKGLVDFERTPNALERLFRADLTQRPPSNAKKAFNAFRTVVEQYPKSEYAHDSLQRMIYLRNRLANYEVHVARYYYSRGAYVAAAQRAKGEIEQYDGAPATREAMQIMIQSYDRLNLKPLADQSRKVYEVNYSTDIKAQQADIKRPWWKFW